MHAILVSCRRHRKELIASTLVCMALIVTAAVLLVTFFTSTKPTLFANVSWGMVHVKGVVDFEKGGRLETRQM